MSNEGTAMIHQEKRKDDKLDEMERKMNVIGIDTKDREQKCYDERMNEYKENSRSARSSNLYGPEIIEKKMTTQSAKYEYRPAAGKDSIEHRPLTRRLHDSHFLLGNQTLLNEPVDSDYMGPNQKFQDRYANRSLEETNVGETAGHSIEENLENESVIGDKNYTDNRDIVDDDQIRDNELDEIDRCSLKEEEPIEERDNDDKDDSKERAESMNDNASSDSRQDEEQKEIEINEINEQRDIDREVTNKASAGRADHRHFETEKSLPWMRMIPGDKNLSEQMFLYLTHNELKGQIQDLEKRENQACSKHQWDEALRLRDMRNRLDLARERNLYRRDDLLLDPEIKKIGMASIEARQKLLKDREELCTNSSMYSEEAKVMWDQWVVEDRKSILVDAQLQREELMTQLEKNWLSLAVEDKQRIADSFKDKDVINKVLESDHDNTSPFKPAGR